MDKELFKRLFIITMIGYACLVEYFVKETECKYLRVYHLFELLWLCQLYY